MPNPFSNKQVWFAMLTKHDHHKWECYAFQRNYIIKPKFQCLHLSLQVVIHHYNVLQAPHNRLFVRKRACFVGYIALYILQRWWRRWISCATVGDYLKSMTVPAAHPICMHVLHSFGDDGKLVRQFRCPRRIIPSNLHPPRSANKLDI